MECVAFHFLNNHVGRHIKAIFLNDNFKIHQAQIVKELFGREHEESFFFIHKLAPLSPDLNFIKSLWDVLEETLQSAHLLHCQYKILTKN